MATRPVSSTLQAWELGIRLRQARRDLGLTATSVAKSVGIAPSNFSAIEAGKRRITASKLTQLAETYELTEAERDLLQTLRGNAEQRNWWHDYSELYSEEFLRFLGIEAGASGVRVWSPIAVPGLLQTSEYARATIRAGSPYIKPVDVGPRLETRLARQALLEDEPRLRMDVLLGEAALRQKVGGPALGRQLDRLIGVCSRADSTVDLHVVPFAADAHPLIGGPLTMLSFDNVLLPDLVWQETAITGNLIDKPQVIRECSASFDEVFESVALDTARSLELVQQIRSELGATS
ncbi:transcriptional regulator with XRE-family HTH domain [Saccharomonospora amisosensis]|uniref:Transcriptional regulator with XRE-family HTH domain n=1 Tax=Saccharomonospora amisosensis TaxID=1128677 RepID=A0A7X5UKM9_9PSEU|nr:Scr1 family TA system antitoxin-like transcriptional regulator [Saccharomonospora amisosensis]NIJ09769.1 transcriptional regulator with XRE-family HTH domain [Saccharomonospora amisosensis]